jgi:uncharacterized protein
VRLGIRVRSGAGVRVPAAELRPIDFDRYEPSILICAETTPGGFKRQNEPRADTNTLVSIPRPGETVPRPSPPPLPGPVLLAQTWADMVFVHWPVAPVLVRGLFPDGTRPDTFDGQTYVGIVGFAIPSTWLGGVLAIGSTHEVNVRLYSVDSQGRQGVVFLSMDVTRPDMVLVARALPGLPYLWSHVEPVRPNPAVAGFRLRRRIPSRLAAQIEIDVELPVDHPSALEVFLTARWGVHTRTALGTTWIPIAHPPFPLHHAGLRHADHALLTAAGVPAPTEAPVGVLWSPGLDARVGRPARVPHPKAG